MPNLSSHPVALSGSFYRSTTTAEHAIGQKGVADDGREYRYVKAGAVALVAGNAIQSPAVIPDHLATTATATAAGARDVIITPGATAGAANIYADGFLQVDTTPGNGYVYGIESHPAITASTAFTIRLKADDPIQVALTTASRLGLLANKYRGVIQFPVTTATGTLVGIAAYVIGANEFGWIQTKGIASPLIAGTPALGALIMSPGTTAGASVIVTTTNLVVAQFVGRMAQIGVGGKNGFVDLDID